MLPWKSIVDDSPSATVVANAQLEVLAWNRAATMLFGWTESEVLGKRLPIISADALANSAPRNIAAAEAGIVLTGLMVRPVHKSGRAIDATLSLSAIDVEDGTRILVATFLDLTVQVELHQALRDARRTQEMIAEVNRAISSAATDEKALCQAVCEAVVQVGGYAESWVGIAVHDGRRSVEPIAAAGVDLDYPRSLDLTWCEGAPGQSPAGTAIRTRKPTVCRRIATENASEPWRKLAAAQGIQASVALPLVVGPDVVGALNVCSSAPDPFCPGELQLLTTLAADLGRALGVRRAEALNTAKEAEMSVLLSRLSEGVVVTNRDSRVTFANEAAARIVGRPLAELMGKNRAEVLPAPSGALAGEAQRRALASGVRKGPAHHQVRHPVNGEWADVRAYPTDNGMIVFIRDITEDKRAELAAADQQARLDLAIEAGEVGLWDWNIDTGQVHFSREWKRQLGYADHEIGAAYAEWESRLHPDDKAHALEAITAFHANPTDPYVVTFRLKHKDGSWRRIEARGVLMPGTVGRPTRMVGTHRDVTAGFDNKVAILATKDDLRSLLARQEASREEERLHLARELHDDLGQALTGLSLRLAAISGGPPITRPAERLAWALEQQRQMQLLIREAMLRLDRVVTGLRPPLLDDLGLGAALGELAAGLETRSGVRCVVELPPAGVDLPSDELALAIFRVAQEALTNVGRHAEANAARLGVCARDGGWAVSVSDDGRGLGEARRAGALGLVGMRERVRVLGGTFSIESSAGRGTTISAWFPGPPQ